LVRNVEFYCNGDVIWRREFVENVIEIIDAEGVGGKRDVIGGGLEGTKVGRGEGKVIGGPDDEEKCKERKEDMNRFHGNCF